MSSWQIGNAGPIVTPELRYDKYSNKVRQDVEVLSWQIANVGLLVTPAAPEQRYDEYQIKVKHYYFRVGKLETQGWGWQEQRKRYDEYQIKVGQDVEVLSWQIADVGLVVTTEQRYDEYQIKVSPQEMKYEEGTAS